MCTRTVALLASAVLLPCLLPPFPARADEPVNANGGAATGAVSADLAIVGAHVVPMTPGEPVLRDHTVLVRGDRIVAVGPAAGLAVPPGAQRVEAHGGYLLPGLIDLHAHPWRPEDLSLFLAAGVTRALVAGAPSLMAREWAAEVTAGTRQGPALHVCAPSLSGVASADDARRAVAAAAAAGYPCIKIYDDVAAEAYPVLTAEARARGLLSISHVPRNLTWDDMLAAAPSAVAHAEEFLYSPCCSDEDRARILRTMRERGIALISTLSNYDTIGRQAADLEGFLALHPGLAFYSPVHVRTWRRFNRYGSFGRPQVAKLRFLLDWQQGLVGDLAAAGVRVLAGTDAGNAGALPGLSMVPELRALEASGLSRGAALAAATRDAAGFLGLGAEAGTVEPGRRADLLLVWGNPLESLANLELQQGVVAGGRWLARADQVALLEAARDGFAGESRFLALLDESGVAAAAAWHREETRRSGRPPVALLGLNETAYVLLRVEERPADAVAVFRLMTEAYPGSWVAWDGLADGLEATGDPAGAVGASRRSLELEPRNEDARARLQRLGAAAAGG